jgi:oxygen-independent coproporphyrinogen III oxidase
MIAIAEPLIHRYDVPGPRYTSYPPVPAWEANFPADRWVQALREVPAGDPFALYAHFPFCAKRCLYCGCNAIASARSAKIDTYLDDLAHELAMLTDALGWGRPVRQMHWGGGTPNLLNEAQTERALRLLTDAFAFAPDAELSVEADPRVVTPGQMAHYRQLGFSRISFGVQDLDDEVQLAIGRVQPLALVQDVVAQARAAGFSEINLDLIYGLPRQTMRSVDATLDAVLALDPDRLATFAYAHLPAQRPHQRAIPVDTLPGTLERVTLFRHIVQRLTAAGYTWIGFDHFARHDDPLAIAQREGRLHRNFMGYTTESAPHLLGVGMSSISEVNGTFAQNAATLTPWSEAVRGGTLPVVRGHTLSADDRVRGAIIKQLLCNLELPFAMVPPELSDALESLKATVDDGLVTLEPDRIVVTDLGRYFLRNLCLPFDAYLPPRTSDRVFSRTL